MPLKFTRNILSILFFCISLQGYSQATKLWESAVANVNTSFGEGDMLQFNAGNSYLLNYYYTGGINNKCQLSARNSAGSQLWNLRDSTGGYGCLPIEFITGSSDMYHLYYDYNGPKAVLSKVSFSGTRLWSRNIATQSGTRMVKDNNGNVAVSSCPLVINGYGVSYLQLSKYDNGGNLLWQNDHYPTDGFGYDGLQKITADNSGNFYLVSATNQVGGSNAHSLWMIKYNSTGTVLWEKLLASNNSSDFRAKDFLYNSFDNALYLCYTGFDGANFNVKLVKFNTEGIKVWEKSEEGSTVNGFKIKTDAQGNIMYWLGPQPYGSTYTGSIPATGTLKKYNSAGNLSLTLQGCAFETDASGNIFLTDADAESSYPNINLQIKKYTTTGTLLYIANDPRPYSGFKFTSLFKDPSGFLYEVFSDAADTMRIAKYDVSCAATATPKKPASISGPTSNFCNGFNYNYSCSPVNGATNYIWTVPAGADILSGQGTTNITVRATGTPVNGSIAVYATNCNRAGKSLVIQVSGLPPKPGAIAGLTSVCANQNNVSYTVAQQDGVMNYSWKVTGGAQIISGQFSNSIVVSFATNNAKIQVQSQSSCGTSAKTNLNVSVGCAKLNTVVTRTGNTSITPNPSKDEFSLYLNNGNATEKFSSSANVIVTDVSGAKQLSFTASTNGITKFGKTLQPGIYFVMVTTANGQQVHKVIKL